MTVVIDEVIQKHLQRHADAAYPEECCGLLLGQETQGIKLVKGFRESQNIAEDSRRNRYVIAPRDVLEADLIARNQGWEILGVYHSHPDNTSRPSEFDREHAILNYSYVIIGIAENHTSEFRCWTVHDWGQPFEVEEICVTNPKAST